MTSSYSNLGKVFLVGAGPGDPGLLTLRGKACIEAANCVVYDALVNPELLQLAPQAEHVYAGKQAGRHSLPQSDINALLLSLSQRHGNVVRLKGGDPFVFGRGGEEALFLAEHGVSFEVVPGVTSGIAAPAYAGIPVTHRGLARGVTLVTGHTDDKGRFLLTADDLPKRGTIVVYMGVRSLRDMVRVLHESGRDGSTPAAMVAWGTYASQRTVVSTLDAIIEDTAQAAIEPPALLVVGDVVTLRDGLNWFEQRPLFGKRILLTHTARGKDELREGLAELGAETLVLPSVSFSPAPTAPAIAPFNQFDWLLLTSANAVAFVFDQLREAGQDLRALGPARIAVVGQATLNALTERHGAADLLVDSHDPHALVAGIAGNGTKAGASILLPRSDLARSALAPTLAASGYRVEEVTAYQANPAAHPEERAAQVARFAPDVVVFTNSAAVRLFAQSLTPELAASLAQSARFASLGPVTSTALRETGFPISIEPAQPTLRALVDVIANQGG